MEERKFLSQPALNLKFGAFEFWDRYDFNYNRSCDQIETGLEYSQAILSYWVDVGYTRWNTTQPALLSLLASTFSPHTDMFLRGWIELLSNIALAPLIYLLIRVIRWVYKRYLRAGRVGDRTPVPTEADDQAEQPDETSGDGCIATADGDSQAGDNSTAITMDNTVDDSSHQLRCFCAPSVLVVALMVIMARQSLCWINLPYPLVQLFVPESLQLWALLLLLTIYSTWIIWKFAVDVRQIRQEQQMLIPPPGAVDKGPCQMFARALG
ncbi:uncharacterized protein LOC129596338 [Paramacrobiotus metropolitanus]|uniref:uncharacterized protein LOC129596338 n=1 Tax=Paramacrobiotus metropolitanus TaxID=2943436 RepID=UPI00244615E0|nr:uncharacterized protein LOC129596338 [Paramacrobiotus metropolitanus]